MKQKIVSRTRHLAILLPAIVLLISCGQSGNKTSNETDTLIRDDDTSAITNEYGVDVKLKAPFDTPPQNKFAKVIGWNGESTPTAPLGYQVIAFARDLNSPRNIYVAENGDVFVAQSRTEKEREDPEKENSRNLFRDKSPNEILRFRDKDNDGIADKKDIILTNLSQPYGMLIIGNFFYVANTDALVRFPYDPSTGKVTSKPEKVLSLPAGGYNNHWTRNLTTNEDKSKIYISVGSGSNVGENGMDKEAGRALILEINPDGSGRQIYAAGLRNPVGMDWEPTTKQLWTAVNERDELGDEIVPDYITAVQFGGWYGWPYTYWGKHIDPRWNPQHDQHLGTAPDSLTTKSLTPDYALGSHTASLGLAFSKTSAFQQGAYIGQHGSWNRSSLVGYKVVFVPFEQGKPTGEPEDFLTGFIANKEKAEVYGRPVAVVFTPHYMLVSDDAANVIWAVLPEKDKTATQ
ncbi:PQQ-dependent sugar dehydrogenase [Sphingobacterium chuzhouense]|uniref:Sorbosone dehydrogenase family protein n=1 Tax=Sphingobacterium chuzhouense TaxID=1742264 RepID=A0ABR7XUY9_9SPHI|nr:PQQ-dependent sugar dehydrogenase [Sphingobacterium chuzhouense]MBD1422866.1 sorbosone dehydrogenase family protein [Sphingobacterium chuzhouense]